MMRFLFISQLLLFCGCVLQAQAVVALFTEGDRSNRLADLVLAECGDEFTFVEREEIDRILAEHRLPDIGGLSAPVFLSADLLAVVENSQAGDKGEASPSRLIIFQSPGGLRLLSRPLPGDMAEAVSAIRQMLREAALPSESKTLLTLAALRDGGVGKQFRSEIQRIAADLQRRLHHLPGVIVTEREFLDKLLLESKLAGKAPKLPPSNLLLRLEFTPVDGRAEAFFITLRITGSDGKELFSRDFPSSGVGMTEAVADFLKVARPANIPNAREEAHRFYEEAFYLKYHGDPRLAMRRFYSAIALHPERELYRLWAIDTLAEQLPERTGEPIIDILDELKALDLDYNYSPGYRGMGAGRSRDILARQYRQADGPLRQELRHWLSRNRVSYLYPHLAALPAEPPHTADGLKHYAAELDKMLRPYYFFDETAYWLHSTAAMTRLASCAADFPSLKLLPELKEFSHELGSAFSRTPEKHTHMIAGLAKPLLDSTNYDLRLLGLKVEFISRMPLPEEKAPAIRLKFIDDILREGSRNREELLSFLDRIPRESPDLKPLLTERYAAQLPVDDPEAAVYASPEKLYQLLRSRNVNALEMRRKPWIAPIHRQFAKLSPEELSRYNPDYEIKRLETGWKYGAVLAAAYEGMTGYILRYNWSKEDFNLIKWDGKELRTVRTYAPGELHFKMHDYGAAAMNLVDGYLLFGTDDQIVIFSPEGNEKILSGFTGGSPHALTMHGERIYAFLGACRDHTRKAEANILISFNREGGEVRTHISTRRDTPSNFFDKLPHPFRVWGLACDRTTGELIFPAFYYGMKENALWRFNIHTKKESLQYNFSRGKPVKISSYRNLNFFSQQGNELFFCPEGSYERQPLRLFVRQNLATGQSTAYGWGNEAILKSHGVERPWGDQMNFYGPFLLSDEHFWCAGGNRNFSGGADGLLGYGMMAHLRPDAPEESPRLIFPMARFLFPAADPAAVLAILDDMAVLITCRQENEKQ